MHWNNRHWHQSFYFVMILWYFNCEEELIQVFYMCHIKSSFSQACQSQGAGGLQPPPTFLLMYDVKIEAFNPIRKYISLFRVKVHSPLKRTRAGVIRTYWR